MYGDPTGVDGFDEGLFFLVGDDEGSMPPRTSVQHMEYVKFVDEEKVAFNLLVERIGEVNATSIAGARFGPLPAY